MVGTIIRVRTVALVTALALAAVSTLGELVGAVLARGSRLLESILLVVAPASLRGSFPVFPASGSGDLGFADDHFRFL